MPLRFLHGHSGARRARPVSERLMEQIEKANGCWLWTGPLDKDGYGKIGINGRSDRAHRVSYEAFVGPIPEGMTIDHVHDRGCRHRSCINPDHLEPVPSAENTRRGRNGALRPAKTTCINGHPWTPENVRTDPKSGKHLCRACDRDRQRRYFAARRAIARPAT